MTSYIVIKFRHNFVVLALMTLITCFHYRFIAREKGRPFRASSNVSSIKKQ